MQDFGRFLDGPPLKKEPHFGTVSTLVVVEIGDQILNILGFPDCHCYFSLQHECSRCRYWRFASGKPTELSGEATCGVVRDGLTPSAGRHAGEDTVPAKLQTKQRQCAVDGFHAAAVCNTFHHCNTKATPLPLATHQKRFRRVRAVLRGATATQNHKSRPKYGLQFLLPSNLKACKNKPNVATS